VSKAKQALIASLSEHFPKAFPADPRAIRPLKIGIDIDIRKACPELNEKLLRQVLGGHTQRYSYLKALARGGERIDMQGNPVEVITAEACAKAKEKLKERLNDQPKEIQPKAQKKPIMIQTKPSKPIIKATIATRTGRPILSLKGRR
jgi:ProP effector